MTGIISDGGSEVAGSTPLTNVLLIDNNDSVAAVMADAVEETQEYSGGAHAQCLVYTSLYYVLPPPGGGGGAPGEG